LRRIFCGLRRLPGGLNLVTSCAFKATAASGHQLTLIGVGLPGSTGVLHHFAELRVFSIEEADLNSPSFRPELFNSKIVALGFDAYQQLSPARRAWLGGVVRKGSLLYLSGAKPECSYSLAPFAQWTCDTNRIDSGSYRIAAHEFVPCVLRNEESRADRSVVVATSAEAKAGGLVFARDSGGEESPLVFAIRSGAGLVIVDLTAEAFPSKPERPIVSRLEDPATRLGELGALFAVELASGRNLENPGYYNLTLDDRPANNDYFTLGRLRQWLDHMRSIAPDAHLDCAWSPDQARPLSRYIDALKRFGAGFVWHGFLHHVDHSSLKDPGNDLRLGHQLMRSITRRYDVELQPVMIFPGERRNDALLRLLASDGFEAVTEYADTYSDRRVFKEEQSLPSYLCYSTPRRPVIECLPVLRRYPVRVLSRDRMLALAALGLPLIAVAHPSHVGLRRVPFARSEPGYLDCVLRFAVDKSLVPLELHQISRRIKEWPQPSLLIDESESSDFRRTAGIVR
jgi:hypothetical protein